MSGEHGDALYLRAQRSTWSRAFQSSAVVVGGGKNVATQTYSMMTHSVTGPHDGCSMVDSLQR